MHKCKSENVERGQHCQKENVHDDADGNSTGTAWTQHGHSMDGHISRRGTAAADVDDSSFVARKLQNVDRAKPPKKSHDFALNLFCLSHPHGWRKASQAAYPGWRRPRRTARAPSGLAETVCCCSCWRHRWTRSSPRLKPRFGHRMGTARGTAMDTA